MKVKVLFRNLQKAFDDMSKEYITQMALHPLDMEFEVDATPIEEKCEHGIASVKLYPCGECQINNLHARITELERRVK